VHPFRSIDRLFVYGTLLHGQPAHPRLGRVRNRWSASVRGLLYALPEGYPGLWPHRRQAVRGEVIEFEPGDLENTLAELDAYEGPKYVRVLRRPRLDDGRMLWAWCYRLACQTHVREAPRIPEGDWLAHVARSLPVQ
jgi:gamma-glutamylcyclotransferase (GGCT)/AIG2-like uncharacterized protein YtfP